MIIWDLLRVLCAFDCVMLFSNIAFCIIEILK